LNINQLLEQRYKGVMPFTRAVLLNLSNIVFTV
jgi:hypothetical protein